MRTIQLKAIKSFISNAERYFRYTHSNSIEYINGPVIWSIEPTESGNIWLRCDNITDEFRWFHTAIHVNVLIGPRGGIKIYTCKGIEKKYLV